MSNSAYIILKDLESKLRTLIEKRLSKITSNWWKKRIPDDIRVEAERRRAANESPWPWHDHKNDPIVSYLDFNDYLKVIRKRDNWRETFSEIFVDEEIISAKLRELDPIRKIVAHST